MQLCPCGSNKDYRICCEPFINGTRLPDSALALMRSRYTAYCQQNANYLIDTWHPDCNMASQVTSIIASFQNTQWLGLTIVDSGLRRGSEDFVTFIARFMDISSNRLSFIYERSRFLTKDNRWYYVEGITPKIGRNDPCLCGSTTKYKKCCASSLE